MLAGHLAIDHPDVACAALLDQARQRHLGGVAFEAEHRLAEEHTAERYAVQAANQLAGMVGFDGMGESELMQLLV